MDDQVRELAEGLTVTQRNNLLRITSGEDYPFWATFNLIWKGLLTYRKRWFVAGPKGVYLTRTGKKVRAVLEARHG